MAIAHTVKSMPSFIESMEDWGENKAIAKHVSGTYFSPTRLSRLVISTPPPWKLAKITRAYIASRLILETKNMTPVRTSL